jgi:hypothetical protein
MPRQRKRNEGRALAKGLNQDHRDLREPPRSFDWPPELVQAIEAAAAENSQTINDFLRGYLTMCFLTPPYRKRAHHVDRARAHTGASIR